MKNRVTGAKLLYVTIFCLAVLLFMISFHVRSEATQFQGMADSSETIINSESSVEIKKILVIEGQHVEKGEKLAELVNPELVLRISDINNQLLQLESEKGLDKVEINSKIIQTKVVLQATVNEIASKIKFIENQFHINKELSSGLQSFNIKDKINSDFKNPMLLEIEALKQEIGDRKKEASASLKIYDNILKNGDGLVDIKINRLKEELAMLENKNSSLAIYSPFQGIIGNVYFRGGEKIAPYTPVLSILQKRPSFVKGYIHESLYSEISLGDEVTVISSSGKENIKGVVAGLGNRIVSYPVRLLKRADVQQWGREITVKIPETNDLILGEKVFINYKQNSAQDVAEVIGKSIVKNELKALEIAFPKPVISNGAENIEVSGAVYDKKKNAFIIVSDDTYKKKPKLFYMNKEGVVTSEKTIKGINKMDDMESITILDSGKMVILSSLNFSKSGRLNKSRKLLALISDADTNPVVEEKIDLFEVLKIFAEKNNSEEALYIKSAIKEKLIDIEGVSSKDGSLFLAFKSPKFKGEPLLLKIDSLSKLIKEKNVNESHLSIIALKNIPANENVSDLYNDMGVFYITTTCDGEKCGAFYKLKSNRASLIKKFDNLKPEGIAKDDSSFFIFFDEGKINSSKFMELRI